MPRGKAVESKLKARDILDWFRSADEELAEFVLGQITSEMEAAAAKKQKQSEAMKKARAARGKKGVAVAEAPAEAQAVEVTA